MKKIEVRVPCGPMGKYSEYHNEAVEEANAEWVLLLNHDVFLACNQKWYEILLQGIEQAEQQEGKTGFITCAGSDRRGSIWPQAADVPPPCIGNPNVDVHIEQAAKLYKKYGSTIVPVKNHYVASFFVLINKAAFKDVKFRNIKKPDYDFTQRMLQAGYNIYVMPGLYVYHRKNRWHLKHGKDKQKK